MDIDLAENLFEDIIEGWLLGGLGDWNSSSSSSDSDDDQVRERRQRVSINNYVENIVYRYSDEEFRNHFRLNRVTAYNFIERYQRTDHFVNAKPRANAITHERAFLMTLWYLANTESFRQISDRFDVTLSSAYRVLCSSVDFIISLADEFIRWPNDAAEKQDTSNRFSRAQNIHGIIGAIDGCHIRIRRPEDHQRDYFNRKKFHSILLQGVVNTKKMFTDVYIGEPGSMHDARVLRKSPIYQRATENPGIFDRYFLIGDSAYPNLPWLIPPFRDNGNLSRQQRLFNRRHASTRVKVEQSFGLLQARFRRIHKFNNLRLDLIIRCTMAACILHNACILQDDNDDDDNLDKIMDDNPNDDIHIDDNGVDNMDVQDTRNLIFNAMFPNNNPEN